DRLKKGLMQTLLTRGIGHKEYKQTPIGTIPKEWQIVKLGEVLELCQYGLSVRFGEAGKYRILKMDDIVNGVVISDNAKYIDLDERTFDNFRLEKGDILFNRTNSYELVGRTGIFLLDGNYTFASYLIRLRPKKEIMDSQFLTYYMVFSNNRLRQLATRAVHQANINATNLQSFTIPVPPLSEQKQIAETLLSLDKKLELENKEKAKLERIKQGLMDLLLTGKIRIKVS
ncbi:MAG: restriction endonuclease subunit S, partial [Candidatus Bathyarchaeia archaeon]